MTSQNHTHKYRRVNIGMNKVHIVFQCALPKCSHYLPNPKLIVGKLSICWNCNQEFVISKAEAKKKSPICQVCWTSKYGKPEINKIVDKMLGEKLV